MEVTGGDARRVPHCQPDPRVAEVLALHEGHDALIDGEDRHADREADVEPAMEPARRTCAAWACPPASYNGADIGGDGPSRRCHTPLASRASTRVRTRSAARQNATRRR